MKNEPGTASLLKLGPVPLNAGISIVAPASFARKERVDTGLERLRALGFTPRLEENALARGPMFFAGTAAQRLSDLHASFTNPETHIAMCVRGGYGSNYLLESLDLEIICSHAKPFFAYSDLTGVQLFLLDQIGMPSFHGPMLAADFYLEDGVHLPSFEAALRGRPYSVGSPEGLLPLRSGTARGILYGGCLSILVSLLGTPWEPRMEGKLLFIEDTGAKPYQIDRMLWQLHHSGKFQGVQGIIFGEMLDCASPGGEPELLRKVLLNAAERFDVPVAWGLRSGHVSRQNVTLTFGVEAELNVNEEADLHLIGTAIEST